MRRVRCCAAVLAAAGLAGCGSSSSTTEDTIVSNGTTTIVRNGSTTTQAPPAHTFSAPGIMIHFTYRDPLAPVSVGTFKHSTGNTSQDKTAALGISSNLPDDLLIVTQEPTLRLRSSISASNMSHIKIEFDRVFSQTFGRRTVSSVTTYGGLPALTYPSAPVSETQTPGTTVRVILLFSGKRPYQLECQATPAHLATIEAACKEMLQTVTIS